MLRKSRIALVLFIAFVISVAVLLVLVGASLAKEQTVNTKKVVVPQEARFSPYVRTIHVGDSIKWVNRDDADHFIIGLDFFNTAGNKGTHQFMPGTVSTGGIPSKFKLTFTQPGIFAYYCHLHAHTDGFHQPVAPGSDGGIQDPGGNYGTPMMGVINVIP